MTHRNHHEREFEAFLAGEESELARLYRRLPQTEPDAKLDASVLALARAAVEPQRVNALRHAKTRTRRPWWLVGLSSAAGVVLAAGIAWQMRNAFQETLPGATSPTAPAAARSERDVIPISAILPPPEPAAAPEPPPAPPAPDVFASAPMPAGGAAGTAAPAKPAPRAAPTVAAKSKAIAATADSKDKSIAADTVAAAPVAQTAAESATPAQPELARHAAVDLGAAPAAEAGFTADKAAPQAFPNSVPNYNSVERKAAIASGTRRDDYGLSAEAAAADPLTKREQRARATRQIAREPAPPRDAAVATEAAPPVAAAPTMTAASPAAAAAPADVDAERATELQRNARLAPEEWIRKIRELLREQRRADALENLALLRRTHPDYVLPEDLRELR